MSTLSEFKDYPIKDFLSWYKHDGLVLSPKFQRNSVWNTQAKSYLIDTILKGLPIPPIFIKEYIDRETKNTVREVIDGQQRLNAIINFYNNNYKIMSSHNKEFGNLTYEELSDDAQIDFLGFNIPIVLVKTEDDSIVYDMFARLNTNNVILNKQELRNSKFWGEFKVFANKIATNYRNFFIEYKTFSDQQLTRMTDIELINSLIIVTLDGIITESPKKIDSYYSKFDNTFENIDEVENKIITIMSIIENIFNNSTYSTKFFHTKVSMYTLFASIYYLVYGKDEYNKYNIIRSIHLFDEDKNIQLSIIKKLITNLENFESTLIRAKNGDIEGERYKEFKLFIDNHRTRTTSKKEREERIQFLLNNLILE
jgi:uncharacterized protein with ParB-like and HNH nuclease domain